MSTAAPDNNLGFQNFFSAQLTGDITSSSTDILMDTIPNSTMGFLVIEPTSTSNREVIFYNSKTALKVVCPSAAAGRGQDDTTAVAHSTGASVIMAPVSAFYEALQSLAAMSLDARSGWVGAIADGESWAYASFATTVGTITVPSDATTKYTLGMRIRISQATGGTKYGIIVKIAATVLTVYFGTDYTLTNETISSPFYSGAKAPLGFPQDPAKWTVTASDSSDRTQSTAVAGTWYNLGSLSISIPIGIWRVRYDVSLMSSKATTTSVNGLTTLSTANNSQSDSDFTAVGETRGVSGTLRYQATHSREKILTIAAATPYFLNSQSSGGTDTLTNFNATYFPAVIRAICAYL